MKASPLRVLMINRPDASAVPGGDTVQMLRTKAGLERLGVQVTLGEQPDPQAARQYDVVHIFNWQQLDAISAAWGLEDASVPVVLSTIFWFHTGHWFQSAAKTKKAWRLAAQMMGEARARNVYEAWQAWKFRGSAEGKALASALARMDLLLPNSSMEIDHLENVLGLPGSLRAKCVVVPNGVERRFFEAPAAQAKPPLPFGEQPFVLQVARVQAAKNQLGLMQALEDLSIPIVFAGQFSPYEGEYVAECQQFAKKRGNIFFTGPLDVNALHHFYASAAVHALPSWRETPGLASLEAAAAGCKIVSTSIGSAREYFAAEAWYCDPGNIHSIRSAVCEALAAKPSASLRQRIIERFTWERASEVTLQAYQKAIHPSFKTSQENL